MRGALPIVVSLVALLALWASGCATSTVLAWDAVDRVAGPIGHEETLRQPGPPVEERLSLALFPSEPEPAASEPPPPSPPPPPPQEEPPALEPPSDAPVGPPLGVRPVFALCDLEGRAEADGVTLLRTSLHWPVYLFVGFPLGFFTTVFAGVTAIDAVRGALPDEGQGSGPRELLLPVGMMGLLVVIMADQVTAAVLSNSLRRDTVVWEGSDEGAWRRQPSSCAGVELEHGGQAFPLATDGSLDAWHEATLVRSLLIGGRLVVRWRGAASEVPVPRGVLCRWAFERGYPPPSRCPRSPGRGRLDVTLSAPVR